MNKKEEISPVVLFTYNRLGELKRTIENLQKASLSEETILYIYSDGAKSESDMEDVDNVREYLKSVEGFKKVNLKFSKHNMGLAPSIIEGVTDILNAHGKIIVLEDDLLVSTNFLTYMNRALIYYRDHPSILSVCGYNMKIKKEKSEGYPYDVFFAKRSSSWGWATWQDKWGRIDWEVADYESFSQDKKQQRAFNESGSDLCGMLKRQQEGKINSWAIRYNYHQFKHNLWSVFPISSKVKNIGFSSEATHTNQKYSRFDVNLDDSAQTEFTFPKDIVINKNILNQFKDLNSIKNRIIYKIKNLF